MTNDFDIHPSLTVACFVKLGIAISTSAAMEKFPFSPALDTTKLEVEAMLNRRAVGALRPGIVVKIGD